MKRMASTTGVASFLAANPDIVHVDAIFFDLCGTVRGKRLIREKAAALDSDGLQMPYSIFFLDVTGGLTDPCGRGISDGDPDGTGIPIAPPVRCDWTTPPSAQVMLRMVDESGAPAMMDPRNVLERAVAAFSALNLTPVCAVELEFYLIDPVRGVHGAPRPVRRPRTGLPETRTQVYGMDDLQAFGGFLDEAAAMLQAMGVPASAVSAEFAPGQFEINLAHGPDLLLAGDHASLLRHAVIQAALAQGLEATFMSKPFPDQTGSGMHIHLSLLDSDGVNVFSDGGADNPVLRHAIAGLQAVMGESMALFTPNINACRRLRPDSFVPVTRDWSMDNRSAALRIPSGSVQARRIEHRVAGAEANPYLVLAAILAGVHKGISEHLQPTPPVTGNVGARPDPALPVTFPDALAAFQRGENLAPFLGEDFMALYYATKKGEYEKFMDTPSEREFEWYL